MDIAMWVYCNNCHRDAKLKLKVGTTLKELEENYSCPHCDKKGKLIHT
jgi:rubredoxin